MPDETRLGSAVPSPGAFIRDELKSRGWTQEDLARVLGRPLPTVNEIIQGKRAVMPEMAVALGQAFGTAAELWMQREAAYRLSLAGQGSPEVRRRARLYELAPIKELQRRGWIRETDDPAELEREVLRFFQIDSLDQEPELVAAFRKTGTDEPLTPAQRAWVYRVRQLAGAQRGLSPFDPDRLDACAADLRKLAAYPKEARKVPKLLGTYGIRFVVVEPLPGTRIDGVALWLDPTAPVIGLSVRFDRIDSFWHTLCHEFMHIVHGDAGSVDTDLTGPDYVPTDRKSPVEQRADNGAAALLVPPDKLKSFILRVAPMYSQERINQFAHAVKVHPGIIVGQLQHRKQIGYNAMHETKAKVREVITAAAVTDGWGHAIDPGVFQ